MTDKTFHLEIITPEKVLLQEDVDSVEVPGAYGEFQILTGHTPFLTGLKIGPVTITKGMKKAFVSISGGYCEIIPDRTTILAHTAETVDKIDTARAEEAQKRAEKRLADSGEDTSINELRAKNALLRSLNRLEVAKMS